MHDSNEDVGMGKKEEADQRRKALADFMERRNLKAAPWAKLAGLKSPNALYNFLNGHSDSLHYDTTKALADAAHVGVPELFGEPPLRGELRDDRREDMYIALLAVMAGADRLANPPGPGVIAAATIGLYERLRHLGEAEIEESELKGLAMEAIADALSPARSGTHD